MRIQERLLGAMLPLLAGAVGGIELSSGDATVGVTCLVIAILALLLFEGFMGAPVSIVIDQEHIAIYSGFYGLAINHQCSRGDLAFVRVRKVEPFSVLEFLSADGSVCLNTTTNWLSLTQLHTISTVLAMPIENLAQADVLPG